MLTSRKLTSLPIVSTKKMHKSEIPEYVVHFPTLRCLQRAGRRVCIIDKIDIWIGGRSKIPVFFPKRPPIPFNYIP